MNLGDFPANTNVYGWFTTVAPANQVASSLANGNLVCVKDGSNANSINGITLTVDSGFTGLNAFNCNTASNSTFYANGSQFFLVLANGNVNNSSVAGYLVGSFSVQKASADMVKVSGNTTAADNLQNAFDDTPGTVPWTGIFDQGTAQSASANTVVLRAAASFGNDTLIGATIAVLGSDQAYWQSRTITTNGNANDTVVVDPFQVTPSGTITYKIWGAPPSSATDLPAVNVAQWNGVNVVAFGAANGPVINGVNSGNITCTVVGNITGNMTGSVGSMNGNVGGSILGNMNGNVAGSVGNISVNAANLVANTLLDFTDAIEVGATPRLALRYTLSAVAGNLAGGNTATVTIKGALVATTRLTATIAGNGNTRTIAYS